MTRIEPVTGKYVYVEVEGREFRVYFEENGEGIPLLCQHTAGADNRQWRYLLNDRDVTSFCRVIAPDLPYHGKSLPPEASEWWKEEYRLSRSFFVDFQVSFSEALGLTKPVYLGCSMGGHLAADLAIERPDAFRAVIGVEASLSRGKKQYPDAWFDHPRIGSGFRTYSMLGMMAPSSPEKRKRETIWAYGQCASSVLRGDLYYYFVDHDVTDSARQIDTTRISVFLLTGEYDPGVSPADTRRLAEEIKGARFTEMKGLGHFGMCEDFEAFKKYLMPILREIAGQGR